ncbi:MAG: tRNA (adenosine(37)-N6)-threonylcarbamoyltransferase complex dimerization subunit type 1 TsaB [Bacillota bacterium]
MLILALDSSTAVGATALYEDQNLIAEYNLNLDSTHSQRLMPQVVRLLQDTDLATEDLDGLVAGIGPGSFTGIRIGLATAKSLAQTLQIPIVGVSTLEALANNLVATDELICPILDARRKRVYTALYQGINDLGLKEEVQSEDMVELEALLEMLNQEFAEDITFIGQGVSQYRSAIESQLASRANFMPANYNLVQGATLARIGHTKLAAGNEDQLFELAPNYLKRSQAELDWEARCGS